MAIAAGQMLDPPAARKLAAFNSIRFELVTFHRLDAVM
jgi:hypothetical protein